MKPGSFTLNPYASSYIPLSRRVVVDENKNLNSVSELTSGNEAVSPAHQVGNIQEQYGNVYHGSVQSADAFQTAEILPWMDHHGGQFYASSSNYQNEMPEKSNSDEEFDMDLAYLQMTFPGTSEESISGVYLANGCDLDATIYMLNQLEPHPSDFSEKLPDTLDIGDVPESGSPRELASQKLKSVTAEAGASTSSSNLLSAN